MFGVSRVRLAIALLLASSACAAAALLPTSSAAASHGRAWTHRMTVVSGQLVDHWTFDDPRPCGDYGDGTVTVVFRMIKTPRVQLVIDPQHAGNPPSKPGSWVVGIPGPMGGARDMPAQPATGTITLVDNTKQHPPSPGGGPCAQPDKSDCGTLPLSRAAKSLVQGYNRHWLLADLSGVEFNQRGGSGRQVTCRIGGTTLFTDGRISGGTPLKGELLLRMPSASTVRHRRVLVVTGTSHKFTSAADCGSGASCSDDITRRVSVTFKRL
jgi:hypothetical protein